VALKTKLFAGISGTLTGALDLNSPASQLDYDKVFNLATGTGAGQADRVWHDQRTLAASTSEDLDLAGALEDALGSPFVLARVKGLLVFAAEANVNNVVVGAASATAWAALLGATGTLTVRPGALVAAFAGKADATGYVCASGSTDLLKIANGGAGTSVTYDIVIVGASA
jgi:hypothetical protein